MKDINLEGKHIPDSWVLVSDTIQAGTFMQALYSNLDKRRSGKTTRLVDNTIQLLFKGEIGLVRELNKSDLISNHILLDRIIKRLEFEHQITTYDYSLNSSVSLAEQSLRNNTESNICFFLPSYHIKTRENPSYFNYYIWLDRYIHCVDGVFYRKPTS